MATDEKKVRREVTQEDLDLNPKLVEKGVQVGDIKLLPPLAEEEEDEDDEDIDTDEDSEEEDSEEEDEEEQEVDSADAPISFKIRNPNSGSGYSIRTFSKKEHGKNYKELAAQFKEANTHMKVADLTDKEAVDAAAKHNQDIKHPIIA